MAYTANELHKAQSIVSVYRLRTFEILRVFFDQFPFWKEIEDYEKQMEVDIIKEDGKEFVRAFIDVGYGYAFYPLTQCVTFPLELMNGDSNDLKSTVKVLNKGHDGSGSIRFELVKKED